MKNNIFFIVIFGILAATTTSDSFGFVLESGASLCLGEQVTPRLRIQGNVKIQPVKDPPQKTQMRLLNDRGGEILTMRDKSDYFFDISASFEGSVRMCVYNEEPARTTFMVDFKIGAQIVDKDQEIVTKEKKDQLEHQIKRWERVLKSIQTKMSLIVRRSQEKIEEADNVSYLVKLLSFCSAVICVAVAFFQMKFMRFFFKKRKII